jgi:small subunit ribosomal protein S1
VHISELANRHVERPDEVVSVGQQVNVKIIEVDSERRRLSLSIKRVDGDNVKPLRPIEPEVDEEAEEIEAVVEAAEVVEAETVEAAAEVAETPEEIEAVVEAAEVVEAEAETVEAIAEAVAEEHEPEPELGLSDDVFPAGAAADDESAEEATEA